LVYQPILILPVSHYHLPIGHLASNSSVLSFIKQ
jgi:hypothetical protein